MSQLVKNKLRYKNLNQKLKTASNVAQTLNLINTKGLTTWREDPWEDDVMSDVYSSVRSNGDRSVASDYARGGSLYNIANPSLYES